jgi:hypothetical protein
VFVAQFNWLSPQFARESSPTYKETTVREYVFTIRSGGQTLEPPLPVLLDHDEAALGYASEMANRLRKGGSYNDPSLVVRTHQC